MIVKKMESKPVERKQEKKPPKTFDRCHRFFFGSTWTFLIELISKIKNQINQSKENVRTERKNPVPTLINNKIHLKRIASEWPGEHLLKKKCDKELKNQSNQVEQETINNKMISFSNWARLAGWMFFYYNRNLKKIRIIIMEPHETPVKLGKTINYSVYP